MAWVSSKPLASGRYRAGYVDRNHKRLTFMGTFKKSQTLIAARAFEEEEREIRLKLRAAPGPEVKHANRPIDDAIVRLQNNETVLRFFCRHFGCDSGLQFRLYGTTCLFDCQG